MIPIVISDTTAITHLAKIGRLNILKWLYTRILVPDAVYFELSQASPLNQVHCKYSTQNG